MYSVDNLPSCYEHITHRRSVDNYGSPPPYSHFHKAYYYDGYFFKKITSHIK